MHTVSTSALLTTGDAAALLGKLRDRSCSRDLVNYYEKTGRLPCSRTHGGLRLFRAEDVETLARRLLALGDLNLVNVYRARADNR